MKQSPASNVNRARRKQETVDYAHGHRRATDDSSSSRAVDEQTRRLRAPAGTSFLLALGIVALSGMGLVRVRASTRVLELGSEITELTDEQSELLEQRRRLSAERAYLRHPEQIREVARDRLGMVPVAPELVQRIRLQENDQ